MSYLTYKEACNYIGIKTYDTLYSYIRNGLPVIAIGNSRRISKDDIDEFMNSHKVVMKKSGEK